MTVTVPMPELARGDDGERAARVDIVAVPAAPAGPDPQPVAGLKAIRRALTALLIPAGIGALYFGRSFLMPIALALLVSLTLKPVVRFLERRGLPPPATALLFGSGFIVVTVLAALYLTGPVTRWIDDAPTISRTVQEKLNALRSPVDALTRAADQVEQIGEAAAPAGNAQRVVVTEPGLLSRVAGGVPNILAQFGLMVIMTLFLLASGDLFYEKVVRVVPTLTDKKTAVRIIREVESDVSRYVLTITLVNFGFGAAVAAGFCAIGMPTPVVWGILAAVLNFVPYLGAFLGIALVSVVALVSFDTLAAAALAPAIYIFFNFIEGQFVTPMVVGRRLEINPVAILVALAFWGWLWGIPGLIFAVPFLVLIKVLGDHLAGFSPLAEFLSARSSIAGEKTGPG